MTTTDNPSRGAGVTEGPTPGPWSVNFRETFPFGLTVTGANNVCVLSQDAAAVSSDQRTRKDNRDGVGFAARDRAYAVALLAQQEANARLIADAGTTYHATGKLASELAAEVEARKDWVCRETYDLTLAAVRSETERANELGRVAQVRLRGQEAALEKAAILQDQLTTLSATCERLRTTLVELLPGLVLDLRYASDDDDKDALRARVAGVEAALSGGHAA